MKEYVIAICDDEAGSLELLQYTLRRLLEKNCARAEIDTYRNGEMLIKSGKRYDLLVLDIEMPGMNGLQTAEQYRRLYEDAIIVFLTGYEEYVFEGYKVNAFRYLKKPIDVEKLQEALQSAMLKMGAKSTIGIDDENGHHVIRQRDIIYVETSGRSIIVRTTDQDYCVKMGINQFMEKLHSVGFISPHKSYCVNMRYVKEFNRQEAVLENGEKVKISCKKYAQFRDAYREYCRHKEK